MRLSVWRYSVWRYGMYCELKLRKIRTEEEANDGSAAAEVLEESV